MIRTAIITACGVALLTLGMAAHDPAAALTSKECSAKFKAAQAAGTTNGMKYAAFRKQECGSGASPAAATETKAAAPTAAAVKPAPAPATAGNESAAVFPNAISAKFANEKPHNARLHTCSEQYQANKANHANGGMPWSKKGGGYWSACNKHLKGGA